MMGLRFILATPMPPNQDRQPCSDTERKAARKAAMERILKTVADRFDELEESELCSIDESDREELEQWQPTRAEFDFVKHYFFRELFVPRPKPSAPTTAPPGSAERISVMAMRLEAGEDLYHPDDGRDT